MANSTLSVAAIIIGVIALLAVIGLGIYLAVKKQPSSSSQGTPLTSSLLSSRVLGDVNSRTIVSNFPQSNACDASTPCSDSIIGNLCMPGSPGNASPDILQCVQQDNNTFAWQSIADEPHANAYYPSNGPLFQTFGASHGNAIAAMSGKQPGTILMGGPDIWIANGTDSKGNTTVTANNNNGLQLYWLGSDNAVYHAVIPAQNPFTGSTAAGTQAFAVCNMTGDGSCTTCVDKTTSNPVPCCSPNSNAYEFLASQQPWFSNTPLQTCPTISQ